MKTKTIKLTGIFLTLAMFVLMFGAFSFTAFAADGDACTVKTDCTGTYTNGFCSVCDGYEQPTLNDNSTADDTTDDYYEIDNAGQLYWFAAQVNGGNTSINAKLTDDINVNPGYTFTFVADTGLVEIKKDTTVVAYVGTGVLGDASGSNTIFDTTASVAGTVYADTANATADTVDLSAIRVWTPIGNGDSQYSGTFDGQNYTISGIYYNNTAANSNLYVGLFGYSTGTVKNVNVSDSYVNAETTGSVYIYIGGVVAMNYKGTVNNCSFGGVVSGKFSSYGVYVGGVVGEAGEKAIVEKCYNTGNISVKTTNKPVHVGGVVGDNDYATVKYCYSTGDISGESGGENEAYIGGVVGCNSTGTLQYCYSTASKITATGDTIYCGAVAGTSSNHSSCYYLDTCNVKNNIGTAMSSDDFASGKVTYLLNSGITDGTSVFYQTVGEGLPSFSGKTVYRNQLSGCTESTYTYEYSNILKAPVTTHGTYENGFCTECDAYEQPALVNGYYEIDNAGQLYWFAEKVNGGNKTINGKLTANIEVNPGTFGTKGSYTPKNNETKRSWTPIGSNRDNCYNGIFDGNGKTVSGLFFNNSGINHIGLFGYIDKDGKIKNVGVVNSYFRGSKYVGGIAGFAKGGIENCYSTATVKGNDVIGGIAGSINIDSVKNCYNGGSVSGTNRIGGIVGRSYKGNVINCYNNSTGYSGSVIGEELYATHDKIGNMTDAQFKSGEVAYLLGSAFGQSLDNGETVDSLPVFRTETNQVYYRLECDGTMIYSNSEKPATHDTDVTAADRFEEKNGALYCKGCGAQVVASLTTADETPVVSYYTTFEDALTAAQSKNGSTVTILADCTYVASKAYDIENGTFTIDMNGKNVSRGDYDFSVEEGADVTLVDGSADGNGNFEIAWYVYGRLTISSGTYRGILFQKWDGVLTIEGGTFTFLQLNFDTGSKISLKGGNFSQGIDFGNGVDPNAVLAPDYYYKDDQGNIVTDPEKARVVSQGAKFYAAILDVEVLNPYDGNEKKPSVVVTIGGRVVDPKNYTVTYSNNINAGRATVTVTAKNGTVYTGYKSAAFTIEKAIPTKDDFTYTAPADLVYNGEDKAFEITTSRDGMGDITVKYYDADGNPVVVPTNAGTYTVKIDVAEGSNYEAITGIEITTFTIKPKEITDKDVIVSEGTTYNGSAQIPTVTINGLVLDTDYTVSWDKTGFIKAGTYTATVTGIGNYSGTVTKTYIISKADPIITITPPVSAVLPGNTILLTITANDSEVNEFTISGGNLYTVSGMKISVSENAVIGQDKSITVTVTSKETENYKAGSATKEINIGMPDFASEIAELEKAINDLKVNHGADVTKLENELEALKKKVSNSNSEVELIKTAISHLKEDIDDLEQSYATKAELEKAVGDLTTLINGKADAETVNQKLNELLSKITALEEVKDDYKDADATLKSELESAIATAKSEAITAAQKLVNDAKIELNAAIAKKADKTELEQAINTLSTAIKTAETVAKAYADTQDAALKQQLEAAITDANKLIASLDQRVTDAESAIENLKTAIEELKAVDESNSAALQNAINNLNDAIEKAKEFAEASDTALSQKLTAEINKADKALEQKIADIQANLEQAKSDLETAIKNGNTELDGKITKLNEALAAAQTVLENADKENRTALETMITSAQTAMQSAIDKVASDLAAAEKKLADAIASGDSALSDRINSVSSSLRAAKTALEKADADIKEELTEKIEAAEATLDAAIKAVQKNLDDAKAELNKAITDGDTELDGKIAALNEALAEAKAALEAANSANKTEITTKIDEADAALQAAIDALSAELDNVRNELNAKTDDLRTFIIIVCVISVISFCGCGALAVWIFIGKKKKI